MYLHTNTYSMCLYAVLTQCTYIVSLHDVFTCCTYMVHLHLLLKLVVFKKYWWDVLESLFMCLKLCPGYWVYCYSAH